MFVKKGERKKKVIPFIAFQTLWVLRRIFFVEVKLKMSRPSSLANPI